MNLSCEITQDLILLYVDDVCSPGSKKAVEEHVAQCPVCRQYLQAVQQPDITVPVQQEPEPVIQERVMKNGFRKLRRRWLVSVLSVFLLFPLLLLTVMGVNEYRGRGLAFTNLDDIFIAQRFMSLIKDRRFEAAAELFDFANEYRNIQQALERTPDDYRPHYELCMVEGEPWAAAPWLTEQYELHNLNETSDGDQLWTYLILNEYQSLLIPEAVWMELQPMIADELPEAKYRWPDDVYYPIDTVWGRFYVYYDLAETLEEEKEITAESLIPFIYFMPYEIYQEAQEALDQKALETYQQTQAHYAYMADMTEGEYVQYMKDQFIQALEVCYADGITIQSPHYSDAYRTIGEKWWAIEISVNQQYPAGESYKVEYHFRVQNGKLHTVGGSRSFSIENDPIHDVLWLHFPEP